MLCHTTVVIAWGLGHERIKTLTDERERERERDLKEQMWDLTRHIRIFFHPIRFHTYRSYVYYSMIFNYMDYMQFTFLLLIGCLV
jgi:hypothetical protein